MNLFFLIAIVLAPATTPAPTMPLTFGLEPAPIIVDTEYRSPMYGLILEPAATVSIPSKTVDAFEELLAEVIQEKAAPAESVVESAPLQTVVAPIIEYVAAPIQQQTICENGVCRIVTTPRRQVVRYRTPVRQIVNYGSDGSMSVSYGSVGTGQTVQQANEFFTYAQPTIRNIQIVQLPVPMQTGCDCTQFQSSQPPWIAFPRFQQRVATRTNRVVNSTNQTMSIAN